MPQFEYICRKCEALFEELFILKDDIEKFRDQCPCPHCGTMSARAGVSITNFSFSTAASAPANSGFHDVDYPTADKLIGRDANAKWENYHEREAKKDKVRKETGVVQLRDNGGKFEPLTGNQAEVRKTALN